LKSLSSDYIDSSVVDINNNETSDAHDDSPETSMNLEQLSLLNKHASLRDINYSLIMDDDRTNPQSPLHSVKTFEELKLEAQLLNGIYHMGFRRPSRIQERALPQLLAYPPRNMIAQSQNGTGKTVGKHMINIDCCSYRVLKLGRLFIGNTQPYRS
jgi:ATP-dependent RNA helicase DDX19/DBP5